jgi:5-methylthioadenosine/S-adenosylhomocysteine deaminase
MRTRHALCYAGGADGRVQVWVGLEHMFYATPPAWRRAIEISRRHNTGFHTPSHERRFDVEETERRQSTHLVVDGKLHVLRDALRVSGKICL